MNDTTTQPTAAARVAEYGVTMRAVEVDSYPGMGSDTDAWDRSASHWRCTLKRGGKRMTIYYHMGSAHTGGPEIAGVLDCLVSDVSGLDNARDFADWCGEYGYDTDSRKAEKIYKAVGRVAASLRRLFDADELNALMYGTERE